MDFRRANLGIQAVRCTTGISFSTFSIEIRDPYPGGKKQWREAADFITHKSE